MALIENAQGRRPNQTPSGYTRLFGLPALGNLISKVQGASISAGTELEKLIYDRVTKIPDLDTFIDETLHEKQPGIWVASKQQVKQSRAINSRYEPDFLAFDLIGRICYVIEVKDGDQFDTKKSGSEHLTLHNFTNDISQALAFSFRVYICSFNATSKEAVYKGLKRKFSKAEILTGRELCDLLNIDYDEIVAVRSSDQERNLDYFVRQLISIPPVRSVLLSKLQRLLRQDRAQNDH